MFRRIIIRKVYRGALPFFGSGNASIFLALLAFLLFAPPARAEKPESWSVVSSKGAFTLWEVKYRDGESRFAVESPDSEEFNVLSTGASEAEARRTLEMLYRAHMLAKCAGHARTSAEHKRCMEGPGQKPEKSKCMMNWTPKGVPGVATDCG